MRAPARFISGPIKISDNALIQFGRHRKIFKMKDIISRFLEIYHIKNGILEDDEEVIKKQVESKVNGLIEKNVFKKDGNYILINPKVF